MENNNFNQPIAPTQPASGPTPEPAPQMQFQGQPSATPQPSTSVPTVQGDVPTVRGDVQTDETKANRALSYFRTSALLLTLFSFYGLGTSKLDVSTCSVIDSVSDGLCAEFNNTLLIKNIILGVVVVLGIGSIALVMMRKRIARTLVPVLAAGIAIAGIALYFVIRGLINSIADATSSSLVDSAFGKVNIEYLIYAIVAGVYAAIWIPYFLTSKRIQAALTK